LDTNNSVIKVYLADCSEDMQAYRAFLQKVLKRAGFDVHISNWGSGLDLPELYKGLSSIISETHCSIHVLGKSYGQPVGNQNLSVPEIEYRLVQDYSSQSNENYRIFVWHPEDVNSGATEYLQEKLINDIKNNNLHNVITSQAESPVVLVEDINVIMREQVREEIITNETELFFIYNELDEENALGVIDLLQDVLRVEVLKISQGGGSNQSAFMIEQVKDSRMVVVYYNYGSEWAVPFTRQLWKTTGGASSKTPVLLIGDAAAFITENHTLNAPNVVSMGIAGELMPLEIKVQYDKMTGNEQYQ
jgi:hypothetical protein